MAALTRQANMLPLDYESKLVVIEGERGPVCSGMAVTALRAKITFMPVIGRMAGIAFGGCTLINRVLMASFASHCGMFSG